ncbi:hypothetical protein BLA27_07310 [Brucella cytisi]|uniref:Uncharacterized protein n=1 Tax=Brucella cytisi TaxID=407152 RepID=A0A1J6HPN2_9HYPH|nr:hypothetical protein BLA27_07310 [Brucella cytisi]
MPSSGRFVSNPAIETGLRLFHLLIRPVSMLNLNKMAVIPSTCACDNGKQMACLAYAKNVVLFMDFCLFVM